MGDLSNFSWVEQLMSSGTRGLGSIRISMAGGH